ncbi:MAG: DUF4386 domain-containing protein [Ornithinimicrobium sp.]
MHTIRVTGGLLAASALLSIVGYVILGTQFGWPGVLDEPGVVALDAFVAAEVWVRIGFYVFLMSSLVLIPAAIGIQAALSSNQPWARAITAFGVLGAFAQMLGWVRWPITVPGLADAWTDPVATETERAATAATYDLVNGYAGGALGEHLGWLLQGIWAVGVAIMVLHSSALPRWFGGIGVLLASVWAVLVPVGTATDLGALELWGLNVYSAWYVWLLAFGIVLVRRRDPISAGAQPVGDEPLSRPTSSS